MPCKDERSAATATKLKTAGKKNVHYIDSKGRSRNAIIVGQGTSSGLKIRVPSLRLTIDNVPAASAPGSVSCYFSR